MGILDNLGSFLSSAKTNETQSTSSTGSSAASGGVSSSAAAEAEVALGQELAGIGKDSESPETTAEKASSALQELMSKLGLSVSEELDNAIKDIAAEKAEEASKNEEIKNLKDMTEEEIREFTTLNPDIIDKEGLKDIINGFEEEASFTQEEAEAYAAGEAEIQKRLDAANEANADNPDYDAEAAEKEIREAYAIENPDYAAAAEEAAEVEAQHDEAMEDEYNNFCEENPAPKQEDFDNPQDFLDAQEEWNQKAQEHMSIAEREYLEENPNYKNLEDAKFKQNFGPRWTLIEDGDLKELDINNLLERAHVDDENELIGKLKDLGFVSSDFGAGSPIEAYKAYDNFLDACDNLDINSLIEKAGVKDENELITKMMQEGFLSKDFGAGSPIEEYTNYYRYLEEQ